MIATVVGAGLAGAFCLSVILASQYQRHYQQRQAWRNWYAGQERRLLDSSQEPPDSIS